MPAVASSSRLVNEGSVAPTGALKVGANFSQGAGGVIGVGLEVAGAADGPRARAGIDVV